tara:strand:+ start:270 stop:440 length:171 start_codon:yes stop_codon:yes gene_type:complete
VFLLPEVHLFPEVEKLYVVFPSTVLCEVVLELFALPQTVVQDVVVDLVVVPVVLNE